MTVLLTGCGMTGPVIKSGGCTWTKYILVGKGDQLTRETAAEIETHNETRKRLCDDG